MLYLLPKLESMMNTIKVTILAVCFLVAAVSCSSNKASDTTGQEYTAAYICPMHCTGSGSEAMGKCPVCKMDYVANKEHEMHSTPQLQQDGHNHDHNHDGHDHSGHNHDHSHEGHSH